MQVGIERFLNFEKQPLVAFAGSLLDNSPFQSLTSGQHGTDWLLCHPSYCDLLARASAPTQSSMFCRGVTQGTQGGRGQRLHYFFADTFSLLFIVSLQGY